MKRLLIMALALMMIMAFSAVPAFAAAKEVVQVSDKYYEYDPMGDGYFIEYEWYKTYESGYLKKHKNVNYNRDFDDKTKFSTNTTVTTYTYDSGRLMKTLGKTDGKTGRTVIFTYKGKRVKTMTYKYAGKNQSKTSFVYDSKGRLIKESVFYYQNSKWVKQSYNIYTYDSKGRIKTDITYEKENGKWTEYGKEIHTYSGKKHTQKHYEEGKFMSKSVETMNSKGNVTKRVYTSNYDKNGAGYTETTTWTYFKNGEIKTYKSEDSTGFSTNVSFRSDGQQKNSITKDDTHESYTSYKYNDKGFPTEYYYKQTINYTDTSGNVQPQTDEATFTYEYDGYYRTDYPETIYTYRNGVLQSMEVRGYKYIVDKTPAQVEEMEDI